MRLTIERIYQGLPLSGPAPKTLTFSPNGKRLTFLQGSQEKPNNLDLWEHDLTTGRNQLLVRASDLVLEDELSDAEKARRERQRISDGGIVEYVWAPDSDALLFPLNGRLYLVRLGQNGTQAVTALATSQVDATDLRFSPKGRFVSFVSGRHLYAISLADNREHLVMAASGVEEWCGRAEFVAQEEMGRFTGYWWAPDDQTMAVAVVDEGHVPVIKRMEVYADRFETFEQRYPAAGERNATVSLRLVDMTQLTAQGAAIRHTVSFVPGSEEYLARVNWSPDGRGLYFQTQNRAQTRLCMERLDPETGHRHFVLEEKDPAWVNLSNDLSFLPDSQHFLWTSERDGFRHIEVYTVDGKRLGALTEGPWAVHAILGYDAKNQLVYFDGFCDSPLELHAYAVPLDLADVTPREPVRVTADEGWHEVRFAADFATYVDRFSGVEQPPQASLHEANGARRRYIEENRVDTQHPLWPYRHGPERFHEEEYGSFENADGDTLYYRLTKPKGYERGITHPAVVYVYGGPRAQVVQKAWQGEKYLWRQYMAQHGIAVLSVDNRGSYHRGKTFEAAIKGRFGNHEVADQLAGVHFLSSLPYIDGARIGIFGWSFGGFMTIMAMLKHPEVFRVGVSVAPVSDWHMYDTHYTERYLGLPQENPDGYALSSCLPLAERLDGKLLLVHGMADDNVLFTHATRMYHALQEAGKDFSIMTYPGAKHGIWGAKPRIHVYRQISQYFMAHL